ncbi:Uncharacterised protein [Arthrobacter agilis]|nr:Uncharacterised protein [Arthrobacter agilis]
MTLVSWKVRTMPMRATLCEATFASGVPSNSQSPLFGTSKPVSRLKSVVFPAPLGPMRAVILWRGISRCSTSTALMPPNVRVTLRAITMGSRLLHPGPVSPVVMGCVSVMWSAAVAPPSPVVPAGASTGVSAACAPPADRSAPAPTGVSGSSD